MVLEELHERQQGPRIEERCGEAGVRGQGGIRQISPFPRYAERPALGPAENQRVHPAKAAGLENVETLSLQGMERVCDRCRSQPFTVGRCSSR